MVYLGIILDDIILANIVQRVSMRPHPVFPADTYPYQGTRRSREADLGMLLLTKLQFF